MLQKHAGASQYLFHHKKCTKSYSPFSSGISLYSLRLTSERHPKHLESSASGKGIACQIKKAIALSENYTGRWQEIKKITAADVFQAYDEGDSLAVNVIENCIALWGMAVANLVSIFNPEKIIFGGGVFGPAIKFIPDIVTEARKWAHPVSIQQVSVESSALGVRAGLFGAASLALHELQKSKHL